MEKNLWKTGLKSKFLEVMTYRTSKKWRKDIQLDQEVKGTRSNFIVCIFRYLGFKISDV